MPLKVDLGLVHPETKEPYNLVLEFDDLGRDQLVQFSDAAAQLRNTAYLNSPVQAALHVQFLQESAPVFTPTLPSNEVCDAFLYRIRPFVLQDDPVSFRRLSGLIRRTTSDPWI